MTSPTPSRRTSHPDRGVDQLLADRLAIARGGDPDASDRQQRALSAGPPAGAGGRKAAPVRAAERGATARHKTLRELPLRRTIEIDLATNETVYTFQSGEFGAALARIEAIEMDLGSTS